MRVLDVGDAARDGCGDEIVDLEEIGTMAMWRIGEMSKSAKEKSTTWCRTIVKEIPAGPQ